MALHDTSCGAPRGAVSFDTTRRSVVLAAGDLCSPNAATALETLCRAYWYPLYACVRRNGLAVADAQDVTQEFFHRLIGKRYLESVDRERGSFRSFLLASMNHLLANEWDKARALKRGGGRQIISLDAEEAEGRFMLDAAVSDSPEKAFDRRRALTLLDHALAQLREEFAVAGKLPQFDALKGFLSDGAGDGDYSGLAGRLKMEASAVAVAVHRLRLRHREIVRAEVAQTVANEGELKAEMSHLFSSVD